VIQRNKSYFHSHDIRFIFGDLNFRVDLPYEEVMEYISGADTDKEHEVVEHLMKYDQLLQCQKNLGWLSEFNEMGIKFMPTYKYKVGTQDYDLSAKKRIPSW
jgi:hypothetical protein